MGWISWRQRHFLLNSLDARNIFAEIVLTVKNQQISLIFLASVLSTPLYYCVVPVFGRICITYIGLTLERFCGIRVFNKKNTQHFIIWRWGVLRKKQDGGWIKICEIFCGKSLIKGRPIDWYHFWPLLFFVRQSL